MCPRTPSSPGSSPSSAATPQPDPRDPRGAWGISPAPSRILAVWHVAVHALAVVSISISGLAWPLKLALGSVLLAHAALRRPARPTPVCRHPDGTWSLPALGLDRLALRPGTGAGPFWARLALGAEGARTVTVLLLVDQLGREDWRRLQAELRRRVRTGTVRARHR